MECEIAGFGAATAAGSGLRRSCARRRRRRAAMLAPTVIACLILAPSGGHAAVDPALRGFVADSSTLAGATSVAVAGHYAYVTGYYSGTLSAVDISNPAAPVLAGSSAPDNAVRNATTVNIAGGYAFVTSKNRNGPSGSGSNDDGTGNSLSIFDITTTPAVPSLVGTVHDAKRLFGGYGIAVSGH